MSQFQVEIRSRVQVSSNPTWDVALLPQAKHGAAPTAASGPEHAVTPHCRAPPRRPAGVAFVAACLTNSLWIHRKPEVLVIGRLVQETVASQGDRTLRS